jgi:DAK2 domain fusion protein YloV
VLDALRGEDVRAWCAAALAALTEHQNEIDELNVYPVPDGDTGTNLALTFVSVVDTLDAQPDHSLSATGRAIVRGALLGARGNSGVIASQWLRGLTETPEHAEYLDGPDLVAALRRACERADASVEKPVDGTILSVARAAADAVERNRVNSDLAEVVRAASRGAVEALAVTTSQLRPLAEAGVVDAAGLGLVVVLDALVRTVTGESVGAGERGAAAMAEPAGEPAGSDPRGSPGSPRSALMRARETGSPEYGYEVVYLLRAHDGAVRRLRERLDELGDSLAVAGGEDSLWKVHVHVNDVGAAIEAGIDVGRPSDITVTRFADPGPDSQ